MDFDGLRVMRGAWEPNVDVVVDDEQRSVFVRAEIAGGDSESLRVFVDERFLYISGFRARAARLGGSYLQKEIADGGFLKRIRLPVAIDYGELTATYADGILTIALPIAPGECIPTARTEIRMIVKRVPA